MAYSFKKRLGLVFYGIIFGISAVAAFLIVFGSILWIAAVIAVAMEGLAVETVFGIVVFLLFSCCMYYCCRFCIQTAKDKKNNGQLRREIESRTSSEGDRE